MTHTPECIARAERGIGGCWCRLIAKREQQQPEWRRRTIERAQGRLVAVKEVS